MKKLLVVAYRFPPFAGTSSTRIASFCKYLPEYGWQPKVVCGDWKNDNCEQFDEQFARASQASVAGKVAVEDVRRSKRVQGSAISKLPAALRRESAKCLNDHRWRLTGRRVISDVIERYGPFDAMLATAPPWSTLSLANWASKRYGLPWVADFRDIYEESLPRVLWNFGAAVEKYYLSTCSSIVTVSEPLALKLQRRHKLENYTVPNGYDPEDYRAAKDGIANDSCNKLFNIVYTGMLYPVGHPARESPKVLFEALDKLHAQRRVDLSDFRVDVIGTPHAKAKPHFAEVAYPSIYNIVEWIDRRESYRRQLNATLLLLLGSVKIPGIMTAKVFEYLASGRPILSICSKDDGIAQLLSETSGGWSVTTTDECAQIIEELYGRWKVQRRLDWPQPDTRVEKYSRRSQTGQLGRILDRVAESQ